MQLFVTKNFGRTWTNLTDASQVRTPGPSDRELPLCICISIASRSRRTSSSTAPFFDVYLTFEEQWLIVAWLPVACLPAIRRSNSFWLRSRRDPPTDHLSSMKRLSKADGRRVFSVLRHPGGDHRVF